MTTANNTSTLPLFTETTFKTAKRAGVTLTEDLAERILHKCNTNGAVWHRLDSEGRSVFYVDVATDRLRVVVNSNVSRIVSVAKEEFATPGAIRFADRYGMTLNLAMASLICAKIVEESDSDGDGTAVVHFEDYGDLTITYRNRDGKICTVHREGDVRPDNRCTTVSQHPAASKHASMRSIERFGVELTSDRTNKIIDDIKHRRWIDAYPPNGYDSCTTALMELEPGVKACVVYSALDNILITVTPIDRFEEKAKRREIANARQKEKKKQRARHFRHMEED